MKKTISKIIFICFLTAMGLIFAACGLRCEDATLEDGTYSVDRIYVGVPAFVESMSYFRFWRVLTARMFQRSVCLYKKQSCGK